MKKIGLFSICFLVLASSTFVSCKKQVAAAVEGDWVKQVIPNGVDADSAIWHFKNGILTIDNLSNAALSDTGKFTVVEKNLKNYVRIEGLKNMTGSTRLNGDWQVIQYKKDMLTLAKGDESQTTGETIGTVVREFVRL